MSNKPDGRMDFIIGLLFLLHRDDLLKITDDLRDQVCRLTYELKRLA